MRLAQVVAAVETTSVQGCNFDSRGSGTPTTALAEIAPTKEGFWSALQNREQGRQEDYFVLFSYVLIF